VHIENKAIYVQLNLFVAQILFHLLLTKYRVSYRLSYFPLKTHENISLSFRKKSLDFSLTQIEIFMNRGGGLSRSKKKKNGEEELKCSLLGAWQLSGSASANKNCYTI